jgi:preprotein translocase subunit SecA
MFSQLMTGIKNEVLSNLFRSTTNLMAFEHFLSSLPFNLAQRAEGQDLPPTARPVGGPLPGRESLGISKEPEADNNGNELQLVIPSPRKEAQPRTGRNDPCPCGSGKKYKNCHGRTA